MGENPKIVWLQSYLKLQCKIDQMKDKLTRLDNARFLPAMPESDGSKRAIGRSDRMASAQIRYDEYKEKVSPKIRVAKAKMQAIEDAVDAIDDPLEQVVLTLRYLDGEDGYKLMRWRLVAQAMYHSDDEADLTRVSRLHGAALLSLQMEDDATNEESDL